MMLLTATPNSTPFCAPRVAAEDRARREVEDPRQDVLRHAEDVVHGVQARAARGDARIGRGRGLELGEPRRVDAVPVAPVLLPLDRQREGVALGRADTARGGGEDGLPGRGRRATPARVRGEAHAETAPATGAAPPPPSP